MCNRYLRAAHYRHQCSVKTIKRGAVIALIAHIHRIALSPFNSSSHTLAADSRSDDHIRLLDRHAVTGQLLALEIKIEKITARRALREYAGGARHIFESQFDM